MGMLTGALSGGGSWLGSLLGVGLAAGSYIAMNKALKNTQNSAASQLQNITQNNQEALATLPEMPEAPTNNPDDAETNASEKERQRQLAAMEAQRQATNPTGGLGVTGTPTVRKKQALGG